MFDAEHQAFSALLTDLTPRQWATPSLCEGWTVMDVATHVAFHIHRTGVRETLGSTAKHTVLAVGREGAEGIDGLRRWFASPCAPHARRSMVNVCELVIHQQDVRRALDLPRTYPDPTIRACLDFCVRPLGSILVLERARRRARGLHLAASDLAWSSGRGPRVVGPAEALLMALAHREPVLRELAGPGLGVLTSR